MLVREAMTKKPVIIEPNALVYEAGQLMRDKKIGSVIVCDGKKPIGIVTERDLVRRVLSENRDPKTVKISEIMSTPIISVSANEDIVGAAKLMQRRGVRKLIVTENDNLIGIITSNDLVSNMSRAVEEFATMLVTIERKGSIERM